MDDIERQLGADEKVAQRQEMVESGTLRERSEEEIQDRLRHITATRREAAPAPRRADRPDPWRLVEMITPETSLQPELWETREDGTLGLRVRCQGYSFKAEHGVQRFYTCHTRDVIWLEGDEEDPNVPTPPAKLSPVVVILAQRWRCESCAAKISAQDEEREFNSETNVRVRESGIPYALASEVSWTSMLETGQTQEETALRIRAIQRCKEWASKREPEHAILLWGEPGTGKTRLAATAAVARLEHSAITWVSVRLLMAQLDAAWNDDDRKRALKTLTSKAAVVLDDLDKLDGSARMVSQLFAAIDVRDQARQRGIIFTSNLKPSELGERLGDVIMSRITGLCGGAAGLLPFPGPDRRLSFEDPETGEDVYTAYAQRAGRES